LGDADWLFQPVGDGAWIGRCLTAEPGTEVRAAALRLVEEPQEATAAVHP